MDPITWFDESIVPILTPISFVFGDFNIRIREQLSLRNIAFFDAVSNDGFYLIDTDDFYTFQNSRGNTSYIDFGLYGTNR